MTVCNTELFSWLKCFNVLNVTDICVHVIKAVNVSLYYDDSDVKNGLETKKQ